MIRFLSKEKVMRKIRNCSGGPVSHCSHEFITETEGNFKTLLLVEEKELLFRTHFKMMCHCSKRDLIKL